jgi:DNA-binding transcriptional LysR family regulator
MGQLPDLDATLVFFKVVELRSFRGAARALRIPKSTVSRKVAELEEQLGARLLQRDTRKTSVTGAGQTYYDKATLALGALGEAASAVTDLQSEPRGSLRISVPVTFARNLMPALLREYLRMHPAVVPVVDASDRQVDLVNERIDVAVRVGPLPDSSVIAHSLPGARQRLVASPDYLARRGVPDAPAALRDHDCLVAGLGRSATWTFGDARKPISVTVTPRIASNDLSLLLDAAIDGFGIARLPSLLAHDALHREEVQPVLDAYMHESRPLHIIYPSGRHLSPTVRAFVDLLRARWRPDAHGAGGLVRSSRGSRSSPNDRR